MNSFDKEELLKLLSEAIDKNTEVDLKIIAHIHVQFRYVRDSIKNGMSKYDAFMNGRKIQPEFERFLINHVKEMCRENNFTYNADTMILTKKI